MSVRDEIFRTRPHRPLDSFSLLYSGYWLSFPAVKRQGRGVDQPDASSAEVKERVELYFFFFSSGPVLRVILPLTLPAEWTIRGSIPSRDSRFLEIVQNGFKAYPTSCCKDIADAFYRG